MLKHRLAHNAVLGAQRQRRLLAFVGWKLAVHSANALVANSAAQRGQLEEREAMLGTLEARLAEARATHGRQLRSIQAAHAAELEAAHADLIEAQEALERLKTFSALKLREMADELERTQQQLREQQQGHLQFESKPMGPDGFGDSWDGGAPIGRVALGARGPNVSGDPKANQPATALRLEMQSLKLVSYEAQLEEGAAKVHRLERRLERKLRHVEAARAELAEYKRAHEGTERLRAEQHAEATRRVEALELLLANREEQANAAFAKRELEASAWRLKAEAKATAAEVLATAPLVLQRTRLREGVIRMRTHLVVWALRHWAHSRARLCMRAWREYTARVQADRANAAVRAIALELAPCRASDSYGAVSSYGDTISHTIALEREPDRYSLVGNTAAERWAAAATSAAAAALAANRAWHERNDLATGGAALAVAAPANAIASAAGAPSGLPRAELSAAGAPSGLLGTRQLSPRGRPQSEVIRGAQLGARQPLPRGRPPTATAAAAPKAASSSLAAAEAAAFIVNKRASGPRPYDGDSPGTAPIGAALRPVGAPSDATKHVCARDDARADATKHVYDAPPDAGTPEASSASRIDTHPRRRQKSRKWAGAPTSMGPLLVAAAPPPASDEEVKRTRVRTLRARLADGP